MKRGGSNQATRFAAAGAFHALRHAGLVTGIFAALASGGMCAMAATVTLVRTPDGGIQPQAVIDGQGVIHLIYFKGNPTGGDIFYITQITGQQTFSTPIRVNSTAGSASATGTIRGAQLALGQNGRVHVAWNGHAPAGGDWMQAPMLYARMNDAGTGFERERDVITSARGLDGGGSVAADGHGNVYVCWHAPAPGDTNGEAGGGVFVAHSRDDGRTFAAEIRASSLAVGACGCCGMKAMVDKAGDLFVFYRGAAQMVNRDETLLVSRDGGQNFETLYSHNWKLNTCPMSSAFLSEAGTTVLAAAETHGRVYYIRVNSATGKVSEPVCPLNKAKYPVAVANARGETLLAWAEGTGRGQGGVVAWQVYDGMGNETSQRGRAEEVPAWSLIAAVVKPDGGFEIFY